MKSFLDIKTYWKNYEKNRQNRNNVERGKRNYSN